MTGVTTVYLYVDEEFLGVYDRWLRVMTGCVLSTLMRAKRLPPNRHRVMLLLDEVAVLGQLDPLERNMGLLRAYCTPVMIWQNLLQPAAVYGPERGEAFVANAACRVFFGTNDNRTATYVSQLLGSTTLLSASHGLSGTGNPFATPHQQQNKSESGYWLLDPAEIQRLPTRDVIIKFRDLTFPVFTRRVDYRHAWRWWASGTSGGRLKERS